MKNSMQDVVAALKDSLNFKDWIKSYCSKLSSFILQTFVKHLL